MAVKEETVEEHEMHAEYCVIDAETAEKVNRAKREGRRVISVGTTSCRTLEAVSDENGMLTLCAVNDKRTAVTVEFTVTEALSGKIMASGKVTVNPDEKACLGTFKEKNGEYYIISWNGDENGINHFTGAIGDKITLADYVEFMKKADFYKELEGFN